MGERDARALQPTAAHTEGLGKDMGKMVFCRDLMKFTGDFMGF